MSLGEDFDDLYESRLRESQPKQTIFRGKEAVRRLNAAIKKANPISPNDPKTYCMDFDGVLFHHESGWPPDKIGEPLGPGIRMAKQIKAAGHRLVVLTARPPQYHKSMEGALKGQGVKVDRVTNVKPPAEVYVDDRAIAWPKNYGGQAHVFTSREGGPGSDPRSRFATIPMSSKKTTGERQKTEKLRKDLLNAWSKSGRKNSFADFVKHVDPANAFAVLMLRTSRENGGDGIMNGLDGHKIVGSMNTGAREGGPGSGPHAGKGKKEATPREPNPKFGGLATSPERIAKAREEALEHAQSEMKRGVDPDAILAALGRNWSIGTREYVMKKTGLKFSEHDDPEPEDSDEEL